MKIISIANQKGGCGKTTTSINLAASLSRNGKRVLLIDLDPQAHASLGLNFENHDSLYNVISKLTPRKLNISDIIKNVEDDFDIAPSSILVGTLEQELADEIGREMKLTEIIADIRDQYDYILIDCPPSLGFLTINSLRASDEVMIPVETSRFSLQGVEHLMDILNLLRDRLNHPVDYRILITMFDSRLRHSFSMLSTIRERFADVLMDTIVHTNVKLKESVAMGQTVAAYDKYCRGSKDYFSLAKELIAGDGAEESIEPVVTTARKTKVKKAAPEIAKREETVEQETAEEQEETVFDAANRIKNALEAEDEVPVAVSHSREEESAAGTGATTESAGPVDDEQEEQEPQEQREEPPQAPEAEVEEDVTEAEKTAEETAQTEETAKEDSTEEEERSEEETNPFQPLSEKMKEMVKEEVRDFVIETRFSLSAPDARSVYVTGSFNDWSLDETCRMKAEEEGRWFVDVNLKPGVYKYQFIVDGRWREDPSNPRQERNSFGDINSLLEVKDNGQE